MNLFDFMEDGIERVSTIAIRLPAGKYTASGSFVEPTDDITTDKCVMAANRRTGDRHAYVSTI